MALSAGTRLGPYEILAPLGAGGMGEVYRARNLRLKREVALKVVPAEVASEPERQHEHRQNSVGGPYSANGIATSRRRSTAGRAW